LTFSQTGLPPDLLIHPSTGAITGSVSYDAASASPYAVIVTVEDTGTPTGINSTTFTWTVTNTNRAPSVTADQYPATEDQVLDVPAPGVLGNDADPDGQAITAALVSPPGHGNLALNGNGAFLYTPYADYFGPDSFTYKAYDGTAYSNVATVNIAIGGVKDPPSVTDPGNQQNVAGEPVTLQIVASDVDGDALSFSIAGQPPDLQINPNTGVIGGILSYESAAGSPYQVTVTVSAGTDSVPVVFSWTVDEKPPLLFLPMIARK